MQINEVNLMKIAGPKTFDGVHHYDDGYSKPYGKYDDRPKYQDSLADIDALEQKNKVKADALQRKNELIEYITKNPIAKELSYNVQSINKLYILINKNVDFPLNPAQIDPLLTEAVKTVLQIQAVNRQKRKDKDANWYLRHVKE